MRRFAAALTLAGLCLFAKTKPLEQVLKSVPERARLKRNPMERDADAPIAGRKLFEEHCAVCHGMAAGGGRTAPPLVDSEMRKATAGEIFWIITNGVIWHGMPSWSRLPEPERWQIVTYLKSGVGQSPLAAAPEEAKQLPNPIAGDRDAAADGGKLFARYCARCHGIAAKGSGSAPSLVSARIATAKAGEVFRMITDGAAPQGMPSWAKLSNEQRWKIVVFLKSLNSPQTGH